MKINRVLSTSPILVLLTCIHLISCTQLKKLNPSRHCLEKRSAIKIGLKKTTYIQARVDSCYNKLVKVLRFEEHHFNFSPYLHDKYSSASFKGDSRLLQFLQDRVNRSHASETPLKIAASSEFKKSQYTNIIPTKLEHALNRKIVTFSKEQEANEYYRAYFANLQRGEKPEGIWYIDNEKNIIVLKDGSSTLFYHSELTPNKMRKKIIAWKGSGGSSPYPIGAFHAKRAIQLSSETAQQRMSDEMKELLHDQKLNGISPAHHLVAQHTTQNRPYSRYQLEKIAKERISRTSKIEYGENDIAALLLILGHMRSLNIKTVLPVNLETSAGILFHSALW